MILDLELALDMASLLPKGKKMKGLAISLSRIESHSHTLAISTSVLALSFSLRWSILICRNLQSSIHRQFTVNSDIISVSDTKYFAH